MSDSWYFTHAGLTCGPVPVERLDEMIASGLLRDGEMVWLDGVDVQIAVESYRQVNRAGSLPTLVGALRQDQPSKPAVSPAPDWLNDVRASERLAAHRPIPLLAQPGVPTVPSDWLDDIRQIEDSCRRRPAAPPPTVVPRVTGLDPETGQILDAQAFLRWQREQQKQREKERENQPGVTVGEAFLAARKALQTWVDGEQNKPLVMTGNMDAIRGAIALLGIINAYQGYGAMMQEKLSKHLEFLVENRQKFYKAFSDASEKRGDENTSPKRR